MKKRIVKKVVLAKSRWLPFIKSDDTCDTCKFLTGKECPFKSDQTVEEVKERKCIFHIKRVN